MICKGVVLDVKTKNDKVIEVVVRTKRKESYVVIAFTAMYEIKTTVEQEGVEKGDYIKLDYYTKSFKWKDSYITSAMLEKIKIVTKKSPQLTIDMDTGEILD